MADNVQEADLRTWMKDIKSKLEHLIDEMKQRRQSEEAIKALLNGLLSRIE